VKRHDFEKSAFRYCLYLEGVVFGVESENWNFHELEFSDEAGIVVVVLDVGVAEQTGGESVVELFDRFARQHRVQIPVAVKVMSYLLKRIISFLYDSEPLPYIVLT
jgi:hypothetical protein